MRVVSCFDGISAGRLALGRAGIHVTSYSASEIEPNAISISTSNWPDIQQVGSMLGWRTWDVKWAEVDLIIGGPPCQSFSAAGGKKGFDDPRGQLSREFFDLITHAVQINPDVRFMVENVQMSAENLAEFTYKLGVEPVTINSALVSCQNRTRNYWANWQFSAPAELGIRWEDIREHDVPNAEAMYYSHAAIRCLNKWSREKPGKTFKILSGKIPLIEASHHKKYSLQRFYGVMDLDGVRFQTVRECERAQTLPDDYTGLAGVSDTGRYIAIGNSWTVDVVAHIFASL